MSNPEGTPNQGRIGQNGFYNTQLVDFHMSDKDTLYPHGANPVYNANKDELVFTIVGDTYNTDFNSEGVFFLPVLNGLFNKNMALSEVEKKIKFVGFLDASVYYMGNGHIMYNDTKDPTTGAAISVAGIKNVRNTGYNPIPMGRPIVWKLPDPKSENALDEEGRAVLQIEALSPTIGDDLLDEICDIACNEKRLSQAYNAQYKSAVEEAACEMDKFVRFMAADALYNSGNSDAYGVYGFDDSNNANIDMIRELRNRYFNRESKNEETSWDRLRRNILGQVMKTSTRLFESVRGRIIGYSLTAAEKHGDYFDIKIAPDGI